MHIQTVVSLIIISASLFLLAELLSRATEDLEVLFGQGLAGGVITGIITALPETIVVIESILDNKMSVAISASIGGNVILFTFGIGIISLVYSIKWKKDLKMKEDYNVEQRFLLFSTILLSIAILIGYLNIILSVLFILLYVYYVAYRIKHKPRRDLEKEEVNIKKDVLMIVISSVLIVFLARPLVDSIVQFSTELGITPAWFALFFIPILSDAEELVTGIRLALSKNSEMGSTALVSLIGSKIQNGTMLLGIIGLLAWTPIKITSLTIELLTVAIINVVSMIVLLDGNVKKWESLTLLLSYFVVIVLTRVAV